MAKTKIEKPQRETKYRAGQSVRLKNDWAKQIGGNDGLVATIESISYNRSGEPRYTVKVNKPVSVVAMEDELS